MPWRPIEGRIAGLLDVARNRQQDYMLMSLVTAFFTHRAKLTKISFQSYFFGVFNKILCILLNVILPMRFHAGSSIWSLIFVKILTL